MPFPPDVKENALVACGRCCCICHKFCGIKIEVHHIREEADGGPNTEDNALPLCFDCHADMRSYDHKHPKGNKYTESELRRHRNSWYDKIKGNIGVANRETVVETDKQVYQQLVTILPWDRSIGFIRTNNFAGFSFERSRLDDLREFAYHCENPAFEFIDPDLEGHRAKLLSLIELFMSTIALETFPIHNAGWNAVLEEWEMEQPERFDRVVTTLHDTAKQIVETYGSIVKTATRKLGLLPPAKTLVASDGLVVSKLQHPNLTDPRHSSCVLWCTVVNKSGQMVTIDNVLAFDSKNELLPITWSDTINPLGNPMNVSGLIGIKDADTASLYLRHNHGTDLFFCKLEISHSLSDKPITKTFDEYEGWK